MTEPQLNECEYCRAKARLMDGFCLKCLGWDTAERTRRFNLDTSELVGAT